MADWIEAGKKAPDFTLAADDGSKVKLSALAGQVVVVYFYPKDDTPGCTKEACAFRDQKAALKKLGVRVLGISPDDVASHVKFRDKYELNFPLLADPEHRVADKYGAWREKNMYGKKSMGIQRLDLLDRPRRQGGPGVEESERGWPRRSRDRGGQSTGLSAAARCWRRDSASIAPLASPLPATLGTAERRSPGWTSADSAENPGSIGLLSR